MIIEISDRLTLVGTSHISKESHKEIKEAFEKHKPDVIAIELDQDRLHNLLHPKKDQKYPLSLMRQVGVIGYLFIVIGAYGQKKLGNLVGMQPGAEMKLGYNLAKEHKKKLLLIDRPMVYTLQMMKGWKKREIFKMFWELLKSPFNKELRMSFPVDGVPSDEQLKTLIRYFKKSYPSLFKILVSSRDTYMATNIKNYHKQFPDVKMLAIVGAGHTGGMSRIFKQK